MTAVQPPKTPRAIEPSQAITAADRIHSAAIHLLRRAAREDTLSGEGPARLSALSVLVFSGGKTLGELAATERVKSPTMSRIVAALARSGLAKTESDTHDKRRLKISVTAKGQQLLQEARQRRLRSVAVLFASLKDAEIATLMDAAEIIERVLRVGPDGKK